MLNRNHRKLIVAAAEATGIPELNIKAMLAAAEGRQCASEDGPVLLTQAQKARQLGVSRFTIRKMVKAGRLKPLELLLAAR